MKLYLDGIGLVGPGLPDWPSAAPVLAGSIDYVPAPVALSPSPLLPPAERRRMTETVKLALAVGSEAIAAAGRSAADLPSVFASSGADGVTITAILEILASSEREVSPTRFHNSVHNAPSGYWSIATQCRQSSTSLCAFDFSFGAGLVEAAVLALDEGRPVLLVCYDVPYPAALDAVRPLAASFGVALVLSPVPGPGSLAALTLEFGLGTVPETPVEIPALEALRLGNPAARALPLLAAIAKGQGTATLAMMAGNRLTLTVTPA